VKSAKPIYPIFWGLRALDANTGGSKHGVFTKRPEALTNDFFVNLIDISTVWTKKNKQGGGGGEGEQEQDDDDVYEGHDRESGALRWTATAVDLALGSHSELRAVVGAVQAKSS
jgi:catalase-peroxidase